LGLLLLEPLLWKAAMPLLDHFHPPLSRRRHWENMHSAWANALRDQLNEVLPPRYFAEVQIALSRHVEIDVATFDEDPPSTAAETGGLAIWAPPQLPQTALLPVMPADVFAVQILTDEEGPRLVGAVELVSPSNKDRPGNRHTFTVECGSYLYQEIGLVVVDIVTNRTSNLHRHLLDLLGLALPSPPASNLYAAAYRTRPTPEGLALDYRVDDLTLGEGLPTMPLWISRDLCLPVHLEQAYQTACVSSRIH
jgi:hypothetical protein